jgi:hypothetical protein
LCAPRRIGVQRRVRYIQSRGEHPHGLFTLAAWFCIEESEDLPSGIRDLELLVEEVDRTELGVADADRGQGSVYGPDVVAGPEAMRSHSTVIRAWSIRNILTAAARYANAELAVLRSSLRSLKDAA